MSVPDPTAGATLSDDIIRPIFFVYMDFDGDPIRFNSSGMDLTPMGTGDPDLDGILFSGIGHKFIDISPIRVAQGGSDTVSAQLSGLPGIDSDTLNLLGDPARWQGREARLWRVIRDADNVQQGGFQHYYTGYMTSCAIAGTQEEQRITVAIETYLAAFSDAPNTTYLSQEEYDSGDLSARAALLIANGNSSTSGTGSYVGAGGGGRIEPRNGNVKLR